MTTLASLVIGVLAAALLGGLWMIQRRGSKGLRLRRKTIRQMKVPYYF